MLSISSLPPSAVPAGVIVFGAATFWLVVVSLFVVAVAVRLAVAFLDEFVRVPTWRRRAPRRFRLVAPTRAS